MPRIPINPQESLASASEKILREKARRGWKEYWTEDYVHLEPLVLKLEKMARELLHERWPVARRSKPDVGPEIVLRDLATQILDELCKYPVGFESGLPARPPTAAEHAAQERALTDAMRDFTKTNGLKSVKVSTERQSKNEKRRDQQQRAIWYAVHGRWTPENGLPIRDEWDAAVRLDADMHQPFRELVDLNTGAPGPKIGVRERLERALKKEGALVLYEEKNRHFTTTEPGPAASASWASNEPRPPSRATSSRVRRDQGTLLRQARAASGKSRPEVVTALQKNGVSITVEAIKKHEESKSLPRRTVRSGYASVYGKSEQELFPGDTPT